MNSLGIRFTGQDDSGDDMTSEYPSGSMSIKQRRNVIWRRILNNLPHILKTIGTERSISALFKCYGVPDYLFKIKEYGGVQYSTSAKSDDSVFSFDTFDYHLNFTEDDQYLSVEWHSDAYEVRTVEFEISLDDSLMTANLCTEYGFLEYSVSPTSIISDQDSGITSSGWQYSGRIAISPATSEQPTTSITEASSAPFPVDVYGPAGDLLGHVTYTGSPNSPKLYYAPTSGPHEGECLYGKIENQECRLESITVDISLVNSTKSFDTELSRFDWEIGVRPTGRWIW
jgi:hypothetical protein